MLTRCRSTDGIIVNHIGMRPAISWLQKKVYQPLSQLLYPVQAAGGFTDHHSFMVQYRAGEDLGLDMHTDDSDVTFNLCLGRNFTGATLTICGDSRMPQHRQFYKAFEHVRGRVLVHLGSRRHGADDIHTGERNNLIVWNQNQRYRDSAQYVNRQTYYPEAKVRRRVRRARSLLHSPALGLGTQRWRSTRRSSVPTAVRVPPAAQEPDPRCLSYTHDRDFGHFLDYPPGKEEHQGGGWCPPAHACYDTMAPQLKDEL